MAADMRTQIRDAHAEAALAVAKLLGEQVVFQDDAGGTAITVWAIVGQSRQQTKVRVGTSAELVFDVVIPRQTSWPPSHGFGVGCTLKVGTTTYEVDSVEPGLPEVDTAAVYTLHCGRFEVNVGLNAIGADT